MALLVISSDGGGSEWLEPLRAVDPDLDVRVWPETGPREDVTFALTWNHPPGELRGFPDLRCIASMGAGVDHILRDPDLPPGVPIVRIVDPTLADSMAEYVLMVVLHRYRQFDEYRAQQRERVWRQLPRPDPRDVRVGVMGLGEMGGTVAKALVPLGFDVAGWARSRKRVDGVRSFAGDAELEAFLARTNVLVCLLPLTPATENILNRSLFDRLEQGAYVVSVGRGRQLVDQDLLAALDAGRLSGACLDVFREEPLPADHPFWTHPGVIVTPHISSLTDEAACAAQIVDNYRRAAEGRPLLNLVDRERAY